MAFLSTFLTILSCMLISLLEVTCADSLTPLNQSEIQILKTLSSKVCENSNVCNRNRSETSLAKCGCACDSHCLYRYDCCPEKMVIRTSFPIDGTQDCFVNRAFKVHVTTRCSRREEFLSFEQDCISISKSTDLLWVSDKETGRIYRNIGCARCNGADLDRLLPWLPNCQSIIGSTNTENNGEVEPDSLTFEQIQELIRDFWHTDIKDATAFSSKNRALILNALLEKIDMSALLSKCWISFTPPYDIIPTAEICWTYPFISACETATITRNDSNQEVYETLQKACDFSLVPFVFKPNDPQSTIIYKNVYCYLCNTDIRLMEIEDPDNVSSSASRSSDLITIHVELIPFMIVTLLKFK